MEETGLIHKLSSNIQNDTENYSLEIEMYVESLGTRLRKLHMWMT